MDILTFADNPWHVVSNLFVFILGVTIALAQKKIFNVPTKISVFYYFWHTIFCVAYFVYSLSSTADSTLYFAQSLTLDSNFKFGTVAVYYGTAIFSQGLGMSYFGTFLVYNIIGFIGMLAFAGALREASRDGARWVRRTAVLLPLLPGISFWSSAIGKDALTFMGAGLVCWAMLKFSKRYPAMILAILSFLLVRPHMAGMLLIALSIAMIFVWKTGLVQKALLSLIVIPTSIAALIFGVEYAGLGAEANVSDLAAYIETRQGYNLGGGSSVDISGMNIPLQMFTYAFHPLVFDASGILGLIISLENLVLLALFLLGIYRFCIGRSSAPAFVTWFVFIYCAIAWFLLASTTANLGISIRQKWMFMPMLYVLILLYQRSRRATYNSVVINHA